MDVRERTSLGMSFENMHRTHRWGGANPDFTNTEKAEHHDSGCFKLQTFLLFIICCDLVQQFYIKTRYLSVLCKKTKPFTETYPLFCVNQEYLKKNLFTKFQNNEWSTNGHNRQTLHFWFHQSTRNFCENYVCVLFFFCLRLHNKLNVFFVCCFLRNLFLI